MASNKSIRAAKAHVELSLQDKLAKGLARASARLRAFGAGISRVGRGMTMLGGAALAPMLLSVKHFVNAGDKLDKMWQQTGVSVEALSELTHAAEISGAGMDVFVKAIGGMQRSIRDAGRELSTKTEALDDLGLSYKKLAGLKPDEQFTMIAEAIARVPDVTQQSAISMELFGRAGRQLLPMLRDGAKGIDSLRKEAKRLGLTMSTEEAQAAATLKDRMTELWSVLKRMVFTIGSALAPFLTDAAKTMTDAAATAGAWLKANSGLVISIAKLAGIVLATGLSLMLFGKIVTGLGVILTVAKTALAAFGVVFSLLTNPIGFVVTALGALGGYMLYTSNAGKQALSALGGAFWQLKDDAMAAYRGIADALATGDIGLAARILWLTLKVLWQRGTHALLDVWLDFKGKFLRFFYTMWYGAKGLAEQIWHGLVTGWIETVDFFSKTWARFVAHFKTSWIGMKGAAEYAWSWIKSLLDDSIDMGATKKRIAVEMYRAVKQAESERDSKIDAAELKRQQQQREEERRHESRLLKIGAEHEEARDALSEERRHRMTVSQQELDQAVKDWRAAIKTAKDQREAKEKADKLARPKAIDDLLSRIGGPDEFGNELRSAVAGTFNAAGGLSGFGAGTELRRTADATEKTAKNTDKIAKALDGAVLAFAP